MGTLYVARRQRPLFRCNARSRASADLMEAALTMYSLNPPRNGSRKHHTIITTIITQHESCYSFHLLTEASGLRQIRHRR